MPHDPSSQDKLAELTGLLELMTAILRRFAGLGDQAIDAGIDEALASIGHFAGVDRSYMFLVDGEYLNNSHEWCAPGIPPEIHVLQQVPWETIHWWRPRLESGESIYIPSVADLPETRIAERELLGSQGIRSLIVVPLMGPDQIKGFIGFDSVREHRTWSEQAILLLRAIADVIIGSLLRRDALKALHQSEQRFSTLVRRASDVVMILGDDSCLRYLGPSACQILGWDEQLAPATRYLDAVHPDERERVHDALKRAVVLPGEHVDIDDHRLRCGDENYIWCQATATDLSADPNIRGIVINAHDISIMNDAESSNGTLHQLREFGVALAIDDFGTGYSSLAYLRQLPINLLKIDRSFIEAMTDSERDRRVVAVICSLGHELGMETIAEGIETERQLEMLRGMRCDLVQGFHLGRPTTPEAIAKLLALRQR